MSEHLRRPPTPDTGRPDTPALPGGVVGTTLDPIRTEARIPEMWPPTIRNSHRGDVLEENP